MGFRLSGWFPLCQQTATLVWFLQIARSPHSTLRLIQALKTASVRLISRRSAGNRRLGPIFLHNHISRGDTRYTGLQALSPAPWQTAAAGIGTDLANLGGRSLSAPHDRVPHCTAASSEAEPFRSSWRPVAAADAGSAGLGADPDTCTKPGLNLGTRPAPMPAPSGVCTADHKRVSFSQLCGGQAPVGSVCLPAALPDCGARGVAAVCRRPVKALPGCRLGYAAWLVKCGSVRRHLGLCMPQRPQAKRSLAGRACAPRRRHFEDCCAHYCSDSRDCAW